jgi:flagellar hook-length control protein FliK
VQAAPQLAAAAPVAAELAAAAVTSITGERTPAKAEPAAPTGSTTPAVAPAGASAANNQPGDPGQGDKNPSSMPSPQGASAEPAAEAGAEQLVVAEPTGAVTEPTATAEPLRAEPALQSAAPADARAPAAVRGAPETVANLAAEIARRMDGRTTRFEMSLDPLDLGAVQVSLEIAADGSLAARVACERPEAVVELRGRSAELQRALEQAGFDLSKGGLSFEHGQGRERQSGDGQPRHEGARARAFQDALMAAEAADSLPAQPLRLRDRPRAGLDLRI